MGIRDRVYCQTDDYLGRFLHFLDKGWTIIITSDHGLITEENHPPILVEGTVSIPVMKELGYTVLKKDENGKEIREIDWTRTRAVAVPVSYTHLVVYKRQAVRRTDAGSGGRPDHRLSIHRNAVDGGRNAWRCRTGHRFNGIGS